MARRASGEAAAKRLTRAASPRNAHAQRADELCVVEAAYRLDGTEAQWLAVIIGAAAPLLDAGWGIAATTGAIETGRVRIREVAALGGSTALAEAAIGTMRDADVRINLGLLRSAPCSSLHVSGLASLAQADPASQALLRLGVRDCVTVMGVDSGRYCAVLSAYRPEPVQISQRMRSRWSRIATHLAAGFRVRRGLAAAHDALAGSDAVLTPAGKVEHIESSAEHAHKALGRAVLALGQARGTLRRHDPDAALEAWQGLVAGRWSLIEHIDTDGKRFLVARKNQPDPIGPAGLSLRERQILTARARALSLKLIAYELGVSIASVSKSLQSGMTKLALASDADLVALFAPRRASAFAPQIPDSYASPQRDATSTLRGSWDPLHATSQ